MTPLGATISLLLLTRSLCIRHEADAEAAQADRDELTPKPTFHPDLVGAMLQPLGWLPREDCGMPFVTTIRLSGNLRQQVIDHPGDYFSYSSDSTVLAASEVSQFSVPKAADSKFDAPLVGLPVLPGHKLSSVSGTAPPSNVELLVKKLQEETEPELKFEVGLDLRRCFEGIVDLTGADICGSQALDRLASGALAQEPILDTMGKGGATIIANLPDFVIKSLEEEKGEYDILKEVMPGIGADLQTEIRRAGGCFRTAIAPICAVVEVPDLDAGNSVHWMIMRKVGIEGEKTLKLDFEGDKIDKQDLKGPKFANNLRDGKTFLAAPDVWHRKDAGFVKLFPNGLMMGECGSPEAAYVLEKDAKLLAEKRMTDYSLFFQTYSPTETSSDAKCTCYNDKPKFPLVLNAKSKQYGQMRIAVGIIDWIERKVNTLRELGLPGSTMLPPTEFKEWWMRMWPVYFHLPQRSLDETGRLGNTSPAGQVEMLSKDHEVVALQKIKWSGGFTSGFTSGWSHKVWLEDQKKYCYSSQLQELYSEHISSGSKYKIFTGDEGRIVSMGSCKGGPNALLVAWNRLPGRIFEVLPEQVMQIPRIFVQQS
eukprot:CAMPEP_0197633988 /NCGR_PEP_ID=MMETSP1338-20131121/10210_1 /TAXON_ID=43686 ORGANISM="Pelagodinium beii, Strain RCC1491" /NCGR_SAMPLE_ID=MMETSP1338 /ASSEMBLY_ACC=CAM_ASM_000754 /LENGTH=593 /DNA_ID=CAMNT_0043205769 /DNA_START=20 /DNA_END=1801 /DNA_ORIENTATION=-